MQFTPTDVYGTKAIGLLRLDCSKFTLQLSAHKFQELRALLRNRKLTLKPEVVTKSLKKH